MTLHGYNDPEKRGVAGYTPVTFAPTRENQRKRDDRTLIEASIGGISESDLEWEHDRNKTPYGNLKALVRELRERADIETPVPDGELIDFAFMTITGYGKTSTPRAIPTVRADLDGERYRPAVWWDLRAPRKASRSTDLGGLPETGPPADAFTTLTDLEAINAGDLGVDEHREAYRAHRRGADGETTEPPTAQTTRQHYAVELKRRAIWVASALTATGRKLPRAPYLTGHSYPVEWNAKLSTEKRPETDFETVYRFTSLSSTELTQLGCPLPETDLDDTLMPGVILPVDRPPIAERATVIDWDNVRDPETGEIHPVCADALERCPSYAAISTSGTGIHQWVLGGLRDVGRFDEPIDDDPFVPGSDDHPKVEIYDGGRHVAMTGKHIERSGEDLIDGQQLIDALITRYGEGDGETATASTGESDTHTETPNHGTPAQFGGYDLDPENIPGERPRCYHAMLQNRADPDHKPLDNWQGINWIGQLGRAASLSKATIHADLETHGTPEYGYDRARVTTHLGYAFSGTPRPPSTHTLAHRGILDGPGCDPTCNAHAPGIGDPKRSSKAPGDEPTYEQMPVWGLRTVAYGIGHNPADDVWRDADTGRAIADTAEEAVSINENTDATVYRALPARIHNLTLDVLDEYGRGDDHGRTPRSVLDDSPIRTR